MLYNINITYITITLCFKNIIQLQNQHGKDENFHASQLARLLYITFIATSEVLRIITTKKTKIKKLKIKFLTKNPLKCLLNAKIIKSAKQNSKANSYTQ